MQSLTGVIVALFGAGVSILLGVPAHMFIEIVATAGILEPLNALSNILAPVVGALATVIVWLHRRVANLEKAQKRHHRTLYGRDEDYLSDGVTKEIYALSEETTDFREELRERFDGLEERLDDVERDE